MRSWFPLPRLELNTCLALSRVHTHTPRPDPSFKNTYKEDKFKEMICRHSHMSANIQQTWEMKRIKLRPLSSKFLSLKTLFFLAFLCSCSWVAVAAARWQPSLSSAPSSPFSHPLFFFWDLGRASPSHTRFDSGDIVSSPCLVHRRLPLDRHFSLFSCSLGRFSASTCGGWPDWAGMRRRFRRALMAAWDALWWSPFCGFRVWSILMPDLFIFSGCRWCLTSSLCFQLCLLPRVFGVVLVGVGACGWVFLVLLLRWCLGQSALLVELLLCLRAWEGGSVVVHVKEFGL